MVNPTLLQKLLKQPSQSYRLQSPLSYHQRNEYHSSTNDLSKAAWLTEDLHSIHYGPNSPKQLEFTHLPQSQLDSDSEHDVFYTPSSSPRQSMDGSHASFIAPMLNTSLSSVPIAGPSGVDSSYSSAASSVTALANSLSSRCVNSAKRLASNTLGRSNSVSPTSLSKTSILLPTSAISSTVKKQSALSSQSSTSPPTQNYKPFKRRMVSVADSSVSQSSSFITSASRRTHNTVDIPEPLPLLGSSALGRYSQLVLPKASYEPSKNPGRVDGRIDLISSGKAQTTMASVEIQKNSAIKLASRKTFRYSWSEPDYIRSSRRSSISSQSSLSFTHHLSPPSHLSGDQVIVQVWATALDALDGAIVEELSKKMKNAGFIPGRSFVGRVVETGYSASAVFIGDWVYGLSDNQRCGTLTEFIKIEKRRLHKAPSPSERLSLSQISLLPLCGVPAQRAVAALRSLSISPQSKVLILDAHKGVGSLIWQHLKYLGVEANVHASNVDSIDPTSNERNLSNFLYGDPLDLFRKMAGSSLDVIVDTIGGREIWDECRRVLRDHGSFITLVGELDTAFPSKTELWKSNLRSLRSTFVKSETKMLRYNWISAASELDCAGQDVYANLAEICSLAETGVLKPSVSRTVPLDHAPAAFPKPLRLGHSHCDEVVVQLISY